MHVIKLALEGLWRVKLDVFPDNRGLFVERFNKAKFEALGLPGTFYQDNHSSSLPGVVRGLHYQIGQGKLIGVIRGQIWDVVVDIRHGSPTFGQHHAETITEDTGTLLWIPSGFAHGFCVLGETAAEVMYKVDQPWSPRDEGGIVWNDADLGIPWPVSAPTLSDKDARLPTFAQFRQGVGTVTG